jgi:four helix bundle protein
MENVSFNDKYRARTKQLALSVIKMYGELPKREEVFVIGRQLLKSSTSVAANFRAVCRARSENERYSKLCIVVEEADETVFWLELLHEAKLLSFEKFTALHHESEDILKVMAKYKSNFNRN